MGFWSELGNLKLDKLRLSEEAQDARGEQPVQSATFEVDIWPRRRIVVFQQTWRVLKDLCSSHYKLGFRDPMLWVVRYT